MLDPSKPSPLQVILALIFGLVTLAAVGHGMALDRPWGWPIAILGFIALPIGLMWTRMHLGGCVIVTILSILMAIAPIATQNPTVKVIEWGLISLGFASFTWTQLTYVAEFFPKNWVYATIILVACVITGVILLFFTPFTWLAWGIPIPLFAFGYGFVAQE